MALKDVSTMWRGKCISMLTWGRTLQRLLLQGPSYTLTAALGSNTVVAEDRESALAGGHQCMHTGAEYVVNNCFVYQL